MSPPSPLDATLVQLEEDLALQETLLQSLGSQDNADKEREAICENITSLRKQISNMQHPYSSWASPRNHEPSSHPSSNNDEPSPYSAIPNYQDPFFAEPENNTSMVLPSRKRPRNEFDDEFDGLRMPLTKSLRTPTPTPRTASPAPSADSFGTDLSDDPILRKLLGNSYTEEKRNHEQYMKGLESRKRQEEEDAEFARQLQEQWSDVPQTTHTLPKINVPPTGYSQTFIRPNNASFGPFAATNSHHGVKSETKPDPSTRAGPDSGTLTPNSDDSGLEEISSSDWTTRFGSTPQRNHPPMVNNPYAYNNKNLFPMPMPGSFPAPILSSACYPASGSSVYNTPAYGTSRYNSSTSLLNRAFNMFGDGTLDNDSRAGSSRMPFDLDNYPLPSALSYADPEQTQEEIKDLLKHIRPDEELTPQQLAEIQPDGLKINLMVHQRKGYAWMKSMEEGTNKGGILADDMGLGKTVQALALILGRPPPPDARRPTLIVAPVALMQQWEREIEKMVRRSHRLEVLILHGNNRNSSWQHIKNYDIILTTYGLLASDLKRKDLWDKHLKLVPDARPKPTQETPVLGEKSHFHRVVLDEAQNIKNKSTKAAAAACRIRAEHRWCLSGTPMQNNVDEIFSLIKFCRIRPYNDFEKFSKDIGRPLKAKGINYSRDKAMKQLQALLRAVLLRRTKKSEIDGQPIIQLPEKHTIEDRTPFSDDELSFYKALETSAQIQFNRFLEKGSIGRHYSHALVLLLRLRQCCCSPQLIINAQDFLTNTQLNDLDYVANARELPKVVVKRLSEVDAFECPICMDAVENPVIFNPCGHSLCEECLSTMVDKAMADAESHKVTCPHCRAEIDTKKVTDHESFLRVHFPDRPGVKPLEEEKGDVDEAEVTDDDNSTDDEFDDEEDDDGEDIKDFIVPDEDEVEYDTDASGSNDKKSIKKSGSNINLKRLKTSTSQSDLKSRKRRKSKGKKKSKPDYKNLAQLRVEGLRNRKAKKKYIRRLDRGYQPSTKIEKTVQLLKDIKGTGKGEKTIIFSSFTSFLDLLEVAMCREDDNLGIYTRYDGSMSAKDRNDSVNRFTDDPKCTAILVSLKAGNAGLNLTAANHVILLDPFWNPFVEYQAADRCYRIGQTREVTIHRVLIGEADENGQLIDMPPGSEREFTVEDRILALQEKKKQLVETALDETASGNIGRLGVRELGYLFGVNSMNG